MDIRFSDAFADSVKKHVSLKNAIQKKQAASFCHGKFSASACLKSSEIRKFSFARP